MGTFEEVVVVERDPSLAFLPPDLDQIRAMSADGADGTRSVDQDQRLRREFADGRRTERYFRGPMIKANLVDCSEILQFDHETTGCNLGGLIDFLMFRERSGEPACLSHR